jgi:hypothetical protein
MANPYPKDRFDDLPRDLARVGAHRAPEKKNRGLIAFAWAALATGVLVVVGVFGVSLIGGVDLDLPSLSTSPVATGEATPTTEPTATPLTDPTLIDPIREITITVLNGTATPGEQDIAGDELADQGWPVESRANASTTDVALTTVYYGNPADEDIARGLVVALGVGTVTESTAFVGADVTIVLGADYLAVP